ncbi:acyl-CoA thioester hydrolase/BAAT C-terminal domain-containing protein [Adhaeribacter radiodurans]|uniref:Prolyl oligopeptidase family serine peptidase n=1 Tax=Adhaeribacter radiodurans TaxID=2745197 RepID=A0A7L7L457_9BACT|nr:acyl-CoA thioester hydrolase/BAAT C-terminal domain-containing protein [Adhaeribacter radiodurans]QMU27375.1 prolyl oligopeptidase family serine peptidase [Adhaeribacter radiodurans]
MFLASELNGQTLKKAERQAIWEQIAPYFSPPDLYKNDFGSYRSPLSFYDGSQVKTKQDWTKRRQEILKKWHGLMGEWPAFIENQKMEILETTRKEGYTQHRIRFNWTPTEKTTGYLSVPDGKGKKPAVITVFYEPETAIGVGGAPFRDFALQLTKRGFVTLSIGTTDATKAQTYSIYYPSVENATVQPLSMLGYAAANAWYVVAGLPEVDAKRIGIMGHSFGGKWAMFASCLFDKFACAVWSDPGIVFDEKRENVNYWEPWYLGYHPKPWRKSGIVSVENPAKGLYPQLVKEGFDLHELHALMAPRPFLVSGGSEDPVDRWVPLNHTIMVNKLLGQDNRVAMTNRPAHSPNADSNEKAYLFLEYFLK